MDRQIIEYYVADFGDAPSVVYIVPVGHAIPSPIGAVAVHGPFADHDRAERLAWGKEA